MEQKQNQPFFWEKVKAALLLAILAVLLVFAVMAGLTFHGLRQYDAQIQDVVARVDRLTAELDQLDVENLVRTANTVSQALGEEEIAGMLDNLKEITLQLSELDLAELGGNISELLTQAQESMANAEAALAKAGETIDALDIEALNTAISDLQTVIEPLANFVSRFG